MAVTGQIGSSGTWTNFAQPRPLNVTLPANTYPSGVVTFSNIGSGAAYWKNNSASYELSLDLYLCDSAGNNAVKLFNIHLTNGAVDVDTKVSASISAPGLVGQPLYLYGVGSERAMNSITLQNQTAVVIDTALTVQPVYTTATAGGSLSASANFAAPGSTVTLYPSANTGYYLTGYTTTPTTTITSNTFVMPNGPITVQANFAKITYTISKGVSPSGAGTVTISKNSATMGESITISQTPATGYYFNGWTTSPSLTISSGAFTMPARNVSITAKYLKRSTCTLSKTSMTGGESLTISITSESSTYSHKYKLSFGTNMETALTNVAAGTNSVTITVPESWSNQIPSAASKTGGSLILYTYSGNTQIGSYTVSNLTYNVPMSAVPSINTFTKSIVRTVGGRTYANVGDYYVQNHCAVRVQASASSGLSATIKKMTVSISGYTGNAYNSSSNSGSIDFTSGLLSNSGSTVITVTATDTRDRNVTSVSRFDVTAYNNPSGSLTVWRVDSSGTTDDMGQYGKFTITKNYTAVGTNSLTTKLTGGGTTETISVLTGNILPGSRKTFDLQQEYNITLTLQDSFETTTITKTLPSAKFIIYVSKNGKKLGFMKATTHGGTNDQTIEFSGEATIYIGNQTLADYIRSVVNS